jgi:hypothetical protein
LRPARLPIPPSGLVEGGRPSGFEFAKIL